MKTEKTKIVGMGRSEMEKIEEEGFFEYILDDGSCLRIVWEDENGKMDKRGLDES